jgi:hypothetical protein
MKEIITQRNRAVFIGGAQTGNKNSVKLSYDRFDKTTYTTDEDGLTYLYDGSEFLASDLPEPLTIQAVNFEAVSFGNFQSDEPFVDSSFEIVFSDSIYLDPDTSSLPEELIVTNDQEDLNFLYFNIPPTGGGGTPFLLVNFDGTIESGTTINISGNIFNRAFVATALNEDFTKD